MNHIFDRLMQCFDDYAEANKRAPSMLLLGYQEQMQMQAEALDMEKRGVLMCCRDGSKHAYFHTAEIIYVERHTYLRAAS